MFLTQFVCDRLTDVDFAVPTDEAAKRTVVSTRSVGGDCCPAPQTPRKFRCRSNRGC